MKFLESNFWFCMIELVYIRKYKNIIGLLHAVKYCLFIEVKEFKLDD